MATYSIKYSSIDELKNIAKVLRKLKFRNLKNGRLNFGFGYPSCNHWYTSCYVICTVNGLRVIAAHTESIGKVISADDLFILLSNSQGNSSDE